jgi:hypothetical protein
MFQKEYNELILNGEKEYTIRKGDRRSRLKVGHLYKCKNKMFSSNHFALIKIFSVTCKSFSELTLDDAKKDLFENLKECKERLVELNGEDIKNGVVSIIHFKLASKKDIGFGRFKYVNET